jgi:YVTN family beta-propeller protein
LRGSPKKVSNLPVPTQVIAFAPDGIFFVTAGNNQLTVIDSDNDEVVDTIPLGTTPSGIAITRMPGETSERLYASLGGGIFLFSLNGLTAR